MINVTKSAAEKFKEVIQRNENPQNLMMRVSFGGHG